MRVIGIDPSLLNTALALPDGSTLRVDPKARKGGERLAFIRDEVDRIVSAATQGDAVTIALENYGFAMANQAHQLGELGGVLRVLFYERGWPVQLVNSSQRMKWATGKGAGDKSVVASAVSAALGRAFASNDEVDAYVIRDIGVALQGGESAFGPLPKYRLEVLETIRNPKPKKSRKKAA